MSLHVTKTQNEITLKGNLTANTIFQIKNICKILLEQNTFIHINLSGLDQVDVSAALMLRDLKFDAYKIGKELKITNGKNEKIVGAFRMLDHQVLHIAA